MRYTGSSCRQCRREGTKLFHKGTKCSTEAAVRAGTARTEHGAPPQGIGVRQAASREAEDQAHLRGLGAAVPEHVPAGHVVARHNGAQPAGGPREPAGQHGLPPWIRVKPQVGAPACSSPAHRGERSHGGHPEFPGAARPGDPRPHRFARERVHPAGDGARLARRVAVVAGRGPRHVQRTDAGAAVASEHSNCSAGTVGGGVVLEVVESRELRVLRLNSRLSTVRSGPWIPHEPTALQGRGGALPRLMPGMTTKG